MNEADEETKLLRAAEAELRRLHVLHDQAIADLAAAKVEAAAQAGDGTDLRAALLANALAGKAFAPVAVPTSAVKLAQLAELCAVLFGAIETQRFLIEKLTRAAEAADRPRAIAAAQAREAARMAANRSTPIAYTPRIRKLDDTPF